MLSTKARDVMEPVLREASGGQSAKTGEGKPYTGPAPSFAKGRGKTSAPDIEWNQMSGNRDDIRV